jgi:uncharacterized protein
MRDIVFAALLCAAASPMSLSSAMAQSPAPDCAKAATPVSRAICADPELRDLDRAIAKAFTAARARVDSDALKALEKDQKAFMDERALVLEKNGMPLADYLRHRVAFLDSVKSPAWGRDAAAFVGTWRNSLGEVRISRDEAGQLVIGISTVSPAENNWICDIEAAAAPKSGKLQFTEDDVTVTLARRGSALVVGDQLPQGDGGRPFCGSNGYIDGAYFKVE